MEFLAKSAQPEKHKSGCLAITLFDGGALSVSAKKIDDASEGAISKIVKLGDFSGASGQAMLLPAPAGIQAQRLLLIGLGKLPVSAKSFRSSMSSALSRVISSKTKDLSICFDGVDVDKHDIEWMVAQTGELAATTTYTFNQFKSKEQKKAINLTKLTFLADGKKQQTALTNAANNAQAIGNGMNTTRTLGNLPGNECPPAYLAKEAKKIAKGQKKLTIKVIEEKEMKELGMGALLSVSAGSDQPAKLIIMEYKGGKKNDAPHVIVGKGVTFDTGGISLKPGGDMDQMKFDMCGAASVLGTMQAVVEMDLALNVIGVITAAENMPSGGATRPGDIVTTMAGLTVEILNTDAEGRLVLCDALTYVKKFKPASVIDIATLTGACLVALGNHTSGMLGNNDEVMDNLRFAADSTQDAVWQLPMGEEYMRQLDSPFADMANIGGRNAGTITAACFLSRFTEDYPWAHLDIAGTAWISAGPKKGATGRPVPLLTQYLMNQV
ncbi:leucyl aminopeptidase [Gammaproteobacteria bacterium 45_16_T64]|nr:leucyl aminopeptidase [Gammaproteobacteria bacterium 45_16_T64]